MNEDQAKGKAKQTEGQAQEAWGDVKEKADDAWERPRTSSTIVGDKIDEMKDELDHDNDPRTTPARARRAVSRPA